MTMKNTLRLLALSAPLLVTVAAFAQQPPSAYSNGTQPIGVVPNYFLLQGSYAKGLCSGTIAAGASASSPIYAFRYTPSVTGSIAVIRRVNISINAGTTGFAAGVANFGLFAARAFTASDTGGTAGTLTGNNGKLKTNQKTTAVGQIMIANTGANTAGTRTLDTDPLAEIGVGVPTTAETQLVAPNSILFDEKNAGDFPLQLANNEGFVIQATVPATGTWQACVYTQWDEYSQY